MKMPPRKLGNGKREMTKDDQDQSYKEKRNKNNDAVKRSRQKTKVQAKETMDKVSRLKQVRILIFRWRKKIQASLCD
jgi:CCAAT/enhancer binding protein (C/EBP) gamma